jgi:integrase
MASTWITVRITGSGKKRYCVEYRLGGREAPTRYGGVFPTKRLAAIRREWIAAELAAHRVPDLAMLVEQPNAPTLAEAGERWAASRVDVAETTRLQQRVSLKLALPLLGDRRVDEIAPQDVAAVVAALVQAGKKPGTVRKCVQAVAMTLDHAGVKDNPARDRVIVRMPRETPEEINPPTAAHVEAVFWLMPRRHRLPLLFLDWSGARVAAIDLTRVGDYDEPRRRVRLRAATTKTRKALWVELHPVLADALEARLGPREDRDPDAQLFAGSGADALRTSIAKACKAAAIPLFSPHDLRHRRISLLHLGGMPWARIGDLVGQRNLAVTANTYSHVLVDEREVDYEEMLR